MCVYFSEFISCTLNVKCIYKKTEKVSIFISGVAILGGPLTPPLAQFFFNCLTLEIRVSTKLGDFSSIVKGNILKYQKSIYA